MTRVIGLMSGTSVDGIDTALVDISGKDLDIKVELVAGETYAYPTALRESILSVGSGKAISMPDFAQLDDAIALCFAQAAHNIQIGHQKATLIGSHGQTVYHRPPFRGSQASSLPIHLGYSLQLGRGAAIANITKITTINNFRAADIAIGGQGAPLVSRIDAALLSHPEEGRCIQNIGGIGNVTYIPPRGSNWLEKIRGWDTGPGNSLLDLAVEYLTNGEQIYDEDGKWAASGTPCQPLVEQWLTQSYFHLPPPKSTGRELFGTDYLHECIKEANDFQLSAADLLATITELTAASIVRSYQNFLPQMPHRVLICGGGTRNLYLKRRLQELLGIIPVSTTDEVGLSADFKEAIAFAVLAYWRQTQFPGNLPTVTNAPYETLLGEVFHIQGEMKG